MYDKSRYCICNNGSWLRIQFCGSGLDKITQSVVDGGYSDNQPFGNVRNDKDYKANRQHLERFCSCADTEQKDGNCNQKYQSCEQIKNNGRKLRDEDTAPLYQSNCRNDGQYQVRSV